MRCQFVLAALGSLAGCLSVSAHGPQIQLLNDSNKIVTGQIILDGDYTIPPATPATSVYVMPLLPSTDVSGTQWYARPNEEINGATLLPLYVSGPGIAWGYGMDSGTGQTVWPNGSKFVLNITGGFKKWDGSAFVDAGDAQLQAHRTSGAIIIASAVTSDTGPFQTISNFPLITASPSSLNPHTSVRYRVLGDGSSSYAPVADGVYLASFNLSMDMGASGAAQVAPSDDFYFVLHKNVPLTSVMQAVNSAFPGASVQVVPEPGCLTLAGFGMLRLRRRG